jgi:hypothetical protein
MNGEDLWTQQIAERINSFYVLCPELLPSCSSENRFADITKFFSQPTTFVTLFAIGTSNRKLPRDACIGRGGETVAINGFPEAAGRSAK